VSAPDPVAPTNNSFLKTVAHDFYLRIVSCRTNGCIPIRAADPIHLDGIELHTIATEQRFERNATINKTNDRAVARQDIIKFVHQLQTAGTRLITDNHARTAGDMAS
jgi:hypothetical protein